MNTVFLITMIISMLMASTIIPSESKSRKILIVYFSHTGNTRVVAERIKKITNGDIFEVIPTKDYPKDYRTLVDQAKKEIDSDFKPELKNKLDNIDDYDVVFIGSPNWWSTIAPPISRFLVDYDLSGKKIIPFMTHGGGGKGRSVSEIKKLSPNAKILDGYACSGEDARKDKTEKEVTEWLRKLGLIKYE